MPKSHLNRQERLAAFRARHSSPLRENQSPTGTEIADLTVYPLREPVSGRQYTVFRLMTKSGLSGYGECANISDGDLVEAKRTVLGMSCAAFEVARHKLQSLPGVQAAVNMALLDILGKVVHAPAYQILGGPTRFKARVMARLQGESEDKLLASLGRVREGGFRAFVIPLPRRMEVGSIRDLIHSMRRLLEKLQAVGGERTDFVLGGTGDLSFDETLALARGVEGLGLLWLDEPCDHAQFVDRHDTTVMPVGFGKGLHRCSDFLTLLRDEAADVIRPDFGLNGIVQIRRIAALAETYYVAAAPHHHGGPISTAAALHLAASLPNFFIQEIPYPDDEADIKMRAELVGTSVETVEDGFARIPTGDGLGITVNEAALEKYRESSA